MTRQLVLMVSLALVLLLARSRGGEARVRLNSIRTVILREGHALPLNRSTWEPSLDLTVSVCVCDVMIVIVTCVSEWRSNPTHAPCVPPPSQLYQCMSDLECSEGSYCHAPTKGPAHSRCQTCRRRKRRCHRDGMCCPGNRCSHSKISR